MVYRKWHSGINIWADKMFLPGSISLKLGTNQWWSQSGRVPTSKTNENTAKIRNLVRSDRRLTTREMADDLNFKFSRGYANYLFYKLEMSLKWKDLTQLRETQRNTETVLNTFKEENFVETLLELGV